jgi:hypothetical protein
MKYKRGVINYILYILTSVYLLNSPLWIPTLVNHRYCTLRFDTLEYHERKLDLGPQMELVYVLQLFQCNRLALWDPLKIYFYSNPAPDRRIYLIARERPPWGG